MTLAEAAGRRYGPTLVSIVAPQVALFVDATGDQPGRWNDHAPPSYAAAALFAVAPSFLGDPDVADSTRSLIHTEQTFSWHRPLQVGETIEVEGVCREVRARGPLNLVTFGLTAGSWLEGTATFLMSAEAAAASPEEPEPPQDAKAQDDQPAPMPFPAPGEHIPPMARSASRADLVRYAGASGDWNPLHWDHEAAVAAGLPGVVAHGLLMTAWLIQAAARHASGPHPLADMKLRFRRPLRPAQQAVITGSSDEAGRLSLSIAADGMVLVSATTRVTA